jgi:prolyl oligopeptidase
MRQGWKGADRLLFDPSGYKAGVNTVIQTFSISRDGKHVALGLSADGAEYSEIRVLDVASGKLSPETFYPSGGPTGWTPDGKGFFYDSGNTTDLKSKEIELNRHARYHKLGQAFDQDRDVLSSASQAGLGIDPKEMPWVTVDETEGLLLAGLGTVQPEQRMFWAPLSELDKPGIRWRPLCGLGDKIVRGLEVHKGWAYAATYVGAPHYKVVRTRLSHPDWAKAETVVPEAPESLQYLTSSRNFLYAVYSNGITGRILQRDLDKGVSSDVKLPAPGMVYADCPDVDSDRTVLVHTSWTQPVTLYDYAPATGALAKSVFNSDVTYPGFDKLVVEEVEVPSHDGTPVPLSIIHRKDLVLDGSAPCILEGYGAYGMNAYTPHFSTMTNDVVLHGVVRAFAHVRGGGEKGEAWYRAGWKTTKPNTWKDFIACGDYLVKHGYTSPAHLTGTGTSAGGILISRAITERPDLFAAAVCNVGCANALRMEFSPNGPVNTPEFGTVKIEGECKALAEMDGVLHVKPGVAYPAVLGVGGWNDPRVPAWQPGKFVAAVQAASTSGRPAIMKVNYDNGHFTEEKIVTWRNFAEQYGFLLWQAGHPEFQPAPEAAK